jgi:hypothetical protein
MHSSHFSVPEEAAPSTPGVSFLNASFFATVRQRSDCPAYSENGHIMSDTKVFNGEDPATDDATDVRRWVTLYRELVSFEEEMLGRIRERMSSLSPEARLAAERTNLPQLEADNHQFHARLSFWEQKLARISPKAGS